jgi:ADP-ribose pyrophosphatase YjhB (NUDIX family)
MTVAFDEPALQTCAGKAPASGAVVCEADGRVWVVSPSNRFGGYTNTFPKGKVDTELSLRANAIKEVFEESGLQVELTGFLCDSVRSTSVTRLYTAMRVGGSPANMGWESQAAHLVPMSKLAQFVSHANDEIVIQSLRERPRLSQSDIVSYEWGLDSVHRILATIAGFRRQYGYWPKRLLLDRGMFDVIPKEILTPLGWETLNQRLEIVAIEAGDIYAEGNEGERFQYDAEHHHLQEGPSVCFWIWGVELVGR